LEEGSLEVVIIILGSSTPAHLIANGFVKYQYCIIDPALESEEMTDSTGTGSDGKKHRKAYRVGIFPRT
jgi:hypothetical protein